MDSPLGAFPHAGPAPLGVSQGECLSVLLSGSALLKNMALLSQDLSLGVIISRRS